jgi:hypothetical protein
MTVYGLDFTSAPRKSKPITCACCQLLDGQLLVKDFWGFSDFERFEAFLASDGSWIAALDFPFGLPLRLLRRLSWPLEWQWYMRHIREMGKSGFEETLNQYRKGQPVGDKLHLRQADLLAGARSPMMLHHVPVGKMLFEGGTRLWSSHVSVLPCRPLQGASIVMEGYPALVTRGYIGKQPYKSDERAKQTPDQQSARQHIVEALLSDELAATYGVSLVLDEKHKDRVIQEPMGDMLDALLCAIQAAWAYTTRDHDYGIPPGHEIEGWIVDPALLKQHTGDSQQRYDNADDCRA